MEKDLIDSLCEIITLVNKETHSHSMLCTCTLCKIGGIAYRKLLEWNNKHHDILGITMSEED